MRFFVIAAVLQRFVYNVAHGAKWRDGPPRQPLIGATSPLALVGLSVSPGSPHPESVRCPLASTGHNYNSSHKQRYDMLDIGECDHRESFGSTGELERGRKRQSERRRRTAASWAPRQSRPG